MSFQEGNQYGQRSSWCAEIDNAPLREAFLNRGFAARTVALKAGLHRSGRVAGKKYGDSAALKRMLGLSPTFKAGKEYPPQRSLTYENAVRLTRAMGLDPVDMGV